MDWGLIFKNEGVASVCSGEKRAELKGKTLHLLFYVSTLTYGQIRIRRSQMQAAEIGFIASALEIR